LGTFQAIVMTIVKSASPESGRSPRGETAFDFMILTFQTTEAIPLQHSMSRGKDQRQLQFRDAAATHGMGLALRARFGGFVSPTLRESQ
jgi:hypothetical protein